MEMFTVEDKGIRYANMTSHDIQIVMSDGRVVKVPPSGIEVRCAVTRVVMDQVGAANIYDQEYGEVQNLPSPKEGVLYVTSYPAARKAARPDVVSPGNPVTLEDGSRACDGLAGHVRK